MKTKDIYQKVRPLGLPICKHPVFFFFMYILGAICIAYTAERVYPPFFIKLFFELFLDLYLLTVVLSLFPARVSNMLATILGTIFYTVAIVDMFCFVRISSTISPSITRLIAETNSEETTGFFHSYVTSDIVWSPVGFLFLLAILNIIAAIVWNSKRLTVPAKPIIGLLTIPLLLIGGISAAKNKASLYHTWQFNTVGKIEKYFGDNFFAARAQYLPIYRLAFALHANRLAACEASHLLNISNGIKAHRSTFITPPNTLVLIIGESYNKHHSQLYGYQLPTTPKQAARHANGELFVFQDAVTPFNITSDVLKNAFSLNDLSQHEDWSDKPLFTQLIKKAGYDVTFISNFFVMKNQKDFADFSGGMFLNDASLSATQFDRRNSSTYQYDEQLLDDYRQLMANADTQHADSLTHRLIIFSLTGQHVDYKDRYPDAYNQFKQSDYHRPDLKPDELQTVIAYDNATLYNDYIVDSIIRIFEDDNAIVLYMADHGEEVYDEIKTFGRQHNSVIPRDMAKNEFQVPFWIWASPAFRKQQSELTAQMQAAVTRSFFSDDLSQLMLYLAGIECTEYRDSLNILSPRYTTHRLRLLRGRDDYDNIMKNP